MRPSILFDAEMNNIVFENRNKGPLRLEEVLTLITYEFAAIPFFI